VLIARRLLPGALAAGPGIAPTSAALVLLLVSHVVSEGTPGTTFTRLGTLQVTGVEAAVLN
jgi:hypothetical protein